MNHTSSQSELVNQLVDAICGLAAANRRTGLWDHVRFHECSKPDLEIGTKLVVQSERKSRRNVELRAVHRATIDRLLSQIIASRNTLT